MTARGRAAACVVLALGLLLVPNGSANAAPPRAPAGFFGVTPQAPLAYTDLTRMARLDLTLRIPFYWFQLEPERGTYDFASLDLTLGRAAKAGVRVLPFVTGSPAWMAGDAAVPPLGGPRAKAWGEFLRRLVSRYGLRGSFWRERSAKWPIRRWQIWNEPNFRIFWRRPSAKAYMKLLRHSERVIHRVDPGAKVMTAGLAPVEGGLYPWEFLRRMYRQPRAKQAFDLVALHPYSTSMGALEYQLRAIRRVMAQAGDGAKPLLVTEVGVASAGRFPNPFDKGRRGQARFLGDAYELMLENRRRWRLGGAYWFTWKDGTASDPYCVFCEFAGLFDARGEPKLAWRALQRLAGRAGGATVR
jgi:hypothetical protein